LANWRRIFITLYILTAYRITSFCCISN